MLHTVPDLHSVWPWYLLAKVVAFGAHIFVFSVPYKEVNIQAAGVTTVIG